MGNNSLQFLIPSVSFLDSCFPWRVCLSKGASALPATRRDRPVTRRTCKNLWWYQVLVGNRRLLPKSSIFWVGHVFSFISTRGWRVKYYNVSMFFSLSLYLCCRFCRFCRFMPYGAYGFSSQLLVHQTSLSTLSTPSEIVTRYLSNCLCLNKGDPRNQKTCRSHRGNIHLKKSKCPVKIFDLGDLGISMVSSRISFHHRTMKMICKRIRLWFGAGGQLGMKSDTVKYPFPCRSFPISHFVCWKVLVNIWYDIL